MDPFLLIASVGFPLVLGIGGIVAWRATRNQQAREETPSTWRDNSLDDWRRERDARAEVARERRAATADGELQPESREGEETTERHHTRMGG